MVLQVFVGEPARIVVGGFEVEVPELVLDGEGVILKVVSLTLMEDDLLNDFLKLLFGQLAGDMGEAIQFGENGVDEGSFRGEMEVEKIEDVKEIFRSGLLKVMEKDFIRDKPIVALGKTKRFL
jgi:hypothetical protein